jgi:aromatic-L-amino-acid/L-tryptophan decarboxylase
MLRRAFTLVPEYLRTPEDDIVRNGSDYGVQLGRRFRALKLWMVIRYFGHEGLAARIREHCRLAGAFASWVEASSDWELLAPAPFSTVCFRASTGGGEETEQEREARLDRLNERVMNAANATGEVFISHTKLDGVYTLRLAIGNIRTTERHVRRAWELLNEKLDEISKEG